MPAATHAQDKHTPSALIAMVANHDAVLSERFGAAKQLRELALADPAPINDLVQLVDASILPRYDHKQRLAGLLATLALQGAADRHQAVAEIGAAWLRTQPSELTENGTFGHEAPMRAAMMLQRSQLPLVAQEFMRAVLEHPIPAVKTSAVIGLTTCPTPQAGVYLASVLMEPQRIGLGSLPRELSSLLAIVQDPRVETALKPINAELVAALGDTSRAFTLIEEVVRGHIVENTLLALGVYRPQSPILAVALLRLQRGLEEAGARFSEDSPYPLVCKALSPRFAPEKFSDFMAYQDESKFASLQRRANQVPLELLGGEIAFDLFARDFGGAESAGKIVPAPAWMAEAFSPRSA
jgi:hypothetical protein